MHTLVDRRACLFFGVAVCSGLARARSARLTPPLVLAQEAPADIHPTGYLVSEKLDGVRAYWDGRAMFFRSGLPVAAPAWFTQRLPAVPLDGELWFGRGRFEALSGAVRRAQPSDAEWQQVQYRLFEQPGGAGTFAERAARLAAIARQADWLQLAAAEQFTLPDQHALQRRLAALVQAGGEGLMLHRADAPYVAGRSPVLLKLKPEHDAEAVVLGHVAGRGKHEGRLGALRVRGAGEGPAAGADFLIGTGFSDAERESPPAVGTVVSYRYRGHTESGVPRFASFLRLRRSE
jgi:DNA ligase 1